MWCLGVSARSWVGPVVWGIAFAGSAGRLVAAAWACCGSGAVPAGGEWRCVAGVYRFHGGGGAICSGVGWACGRLPAGSGCRGRTVGGYSAASPLCVPWWPLVGWLKGVFLGCTASMGAPLCVGAPQRWVRRVVGVGLVSVSTVCLAAVCRVSSSAAPHGGLLWWCLGGGLGLCGSWEDAGHAGSGWLGGGGRVCGLACLPSAPPVAPSSACPLLLSFCWLVWLFFFFGGGVAGVLCMGVGVCRCWLPVPRAPVRGGLTAGGWRQWWRGACVGGCGSWLVSGSVDGRGRACGCVRGVG